jgi:hypothetical protein
MLRYLLVSILDPSFFIQPFQIIFPHIFLIFFLVNIHEQLPRILNIQTLNPIIHLRVITKLLIYPCQHTASDQNFSLGELFEEQIQEIFHFLPVMPPKTIDIIQNQQEIFIMKLPEDISKL